MKTGRFKVPTWALCYLINGDRDTIEPEEEKMIDDWLEKNGILDVWPPDDVDAESYFTYFPPFGLGCDVVECECVLEW